MASLAQKIERAIHREQPARFFSFETVLLGASTAYGTVVRCHRAAVGHGIIRPKRLPCPVVSIGNITVGGTGKTPMTLYLARLAKRLGYHVAIVSRGYRGESEKQGGIVSDGVTLLLPPESAGDEPYMMARALPGVPVVVGQNRYDAGCRAISAFSPDLIILDDGFQHIKLARDLDLVLVDHQRPFGNRHLLPRGPLREPVSAIKRADIIIETRCEHREGGKSALEKTMNRISPEIPTFRSAHTSFIARIARGAESVLSDPRESDNPPELQTLKEKRVVAFSGLAGNRNFHDSLVTLGCHLVGTIEFPDHHWFRQNDLASVQQLAESRRADLILTTRKDAARMATDIQWPRDLVIMDIAPDFGSRAEDFDKLIADKLETLMERYRGLPHEAA